MIGQQLCEHVICQSNAASVSFVLPQILRTEACTHSILSIRLSRVIIIINDIYKAQTSPRSKCAKSTIAQ